MITGGTGQLGRALVRRAPAGADLVITDRSTLDFTNGDAIAHAIVIHRPDVVVNCAAYTAVDRAESEPQLAHVVNADAPEVLAASCAALDITLVQLSTDFVFDGSKSRPYAPDDVPNPVNVYGASKLAGERAVLGEPRLRAFVLRTAWVYAADGRNFVATILRLLREKRRANVVADQIGTPTSAASLANAVWRVVADRGDGAVLHHTDAGVASWYDFAIAIGEEATALGLLEAGWDVAPIPTRAFPAPAQRPAYSVLDKDTSWARLGIRPDHWRVELRRVLAEAHR